MEGQCTSFSWEFCTKEDGLGDLKHSLLYTTLELETTIISAREEILRREYEIINLKDLLNRAIKEKDEVEAKCQKLMLENLMLQKPQQKQQQSESESKGSDSSKMFGCSESDDNTIQSSQSDPLVSGEVPPGAWKIACEKPLPEKGKLLQAVMEAGPLLQNLLLAGPLPHWQHPPPLVDSIDIPPVVISSSQNSCIDIRKRINSLLCNVSELPLTKCQKVVQ